MPPHALDILLKLLSAILIGGLIGAEREYRDKAAGFRSNILITVGATMFTILSMTIDPGASSRVASNIVTGIGFLGAGAIMHEHGRVGGLTTAATVWFAAAIGMAIGAGQYPLVVIGTVIVLVVLLLFPDVEHWISKLRETRTYKIVLSPKDADHLDQIDRALHTCSLKVLERHRTKTEDAITSTWTAHGTPQHQEQFVKLMMQDDRIRELTY